MVTEVDNCRQCPCQYTQSKGIDKPLAQLRSGTVSYYEQDGLGSVTSLSNSAGTLAETYAYDSYGKLTASTGTLVNSFQYTGREFDSETGIYYYRARYFDPSVLPRSVWLFYTNLVELIWPPSMMGPWIGVPVNLVLFTVLGFAVALLGRTRRRLAIAYVVVVTLVFLMAQLEAGFVFAHIHLPALVVALVLYAIPFWLVMRASATRTA